MVFARFWWQGVLVALPNSSLKRTNQSLRDWSCRLAQALGLWFTRVRLHSCLRRFAPRMPTAEAAAHAVFNGGGSLVRLFPAGAGARRRPRISQASGSETSGDSDFGKCGAGPVLALPCRSGSGSLGLTTRSSGPINRFAIDVAA